MSSVVFVADICGLLSVIVELWDYERMYACVDEGDEWANKYL